MPEKHSRIKAVVKRVEALRARIKLRRELKKGRCSKGRETIISPLHDFCVSFILMAYGLQTIVGPVGYLNVISEEDRRDMVERLHEEVTSRVTVLPLFPMHR